MSHAFIIFVFIVIVLILLLDYVVGAKISFFYRGNFVLQQVEGVVQLILFVSVELFHFLLFPATSIPGWSSGTMGPGVSKERAFSEHHSCSNSADIPKERIQVALPSTISRNSLDIITPPFNIAIQLK
jgi:hypothetical protein